MRYAIIFLCALLAGCHMVGFMEEQPFDPTMSIMPLWERYQQCRMTSDSAELLQLVEQLERPMPLGSEPPAWLARWGDHVAKQPLRLAVNPEALGVACTLRAASVLAETDHATEAGILYRWILVRYSSREWAYYVQEARAGLDRLVVSGPAVLARRSTASPSH